MSRHITQRLRRLRAAKEAGQITVENVLWVVAGLGFVALASGAILTVLNTNISLF